MSHPETMAGQLRYAALEHAHNGLLRRAADEIERLEATVARLRDGHEAVADVFHDALTKAEARATAAETREQDVRELLHKTLLEAVPAFALRDTLTRVASTVTSPTERWQGSDDGHEWVDCEDDPTGSYGHVRKVWVKP